MDVARKAVTFLQKRAPRLKLIVNADVPERHNLGAARLDLPAIRIFEGRNFIDSVVWHSRRRCNDGAGRRVSSFRRPQWQSNPAFHAACPHTVHCVAERRHTFAALPHEFAGYRSLHRPADRAGRNGLARPSPGKLNRGTCQHGLE